MPRGPPLPMGPPRPLNIPRPLIIMPRIPRLKLPRPRLRWFSCFLPKPFSLAS